MNRKIVCLSLFVAILFISLLTVTHPVNGDFHQSVNSAIQDSTDVFPTVSAGGFTIVSPHNRTYASNHLPLMITLVCTGFRGAITYSLNYSIDGKYQGPIPLVINYGSELHVLADGTGTVNLPELSEGSHSLSACYEADISTGGQPGAPFKLKSPGVYSLSYGVTVYFTIDETLPQISNVSIENKTYTTAGIPLNFTVNENDSQAKYSLDEYGNVTLAGNTTLAALSEGSHNIALYITDDAGNEAVSKVAFSVNTCSTDISSHSSQAEDSTDSFTIMLIIVVIVIIIVSLVVCYTYKRRKS